MRGKLNYSFARDQKGNIVNATAASKGNLYTCLICQQELTLKKSERKLKRPHFSHRQLTTNCTPESALHFAFKTLLFNKIKKTIGKKSELSIIWDCRYCKKEHNGNLLKRTADVKSEYTIKADLKAKQFFIPDIALFDENNKVFAVIEVIVTHDPEAKLLEFYQKNKITYIFFHIKADTDLKLIKGRKLKPSYVHYCVNPKCHKCAGFMLETFMTVINGQCELCSNPLKVAVLERLSHEKNNFYTGPNNFFYDELQTAISRGVHIVKQYSKKMRISYLANSCKNCNGFVGNYNIYQQFYLPAMLGKYTYDRFVTGYHCENCDQSDYKTFNFNY